MVSSRFSLPVALVLVLALIPTIIHSYLDSRHDDGLSVQNLPRVLNGYSSKDTDRNPQWGEDVFDSQDWIERNYSSPGGPVVRLFAARSYDHKRLYHHPELGLSYGTSLRSQGVIHLPGPSPIAVHYLRNERGRGGVVYALLYDDEVVEDPISHQIRDSFNMLFGAKKPMTLFYVSTSDLPAVEDLDSSPGALVLRTAVESFRLQSPALTVQ